MHLQAVLVEGVDDGIGKIARQPLGRQRLLLRMPHHRALAHLGPRQVDAFRLLVGAGDEALAGDVGHRAAQRWMQRVGVDGDEHHLLARHALADGAAEERVGQIPAEIDPHYRVVERVLRRGQHHVIGLLVQIGLPIFHRALARELIARSFAAAAQHRGGNLNLVIPARLGGCVFVKKTNGIPAFLHFNFGKNFLCNNYIT